MVALTIHNAAIDPKVRDLLFEVHSDIHEILNKTSDDVRKVFNEALTGRLNALKEAAASRSEVSVCSRAILEFNRKYKRWRLCELTKHDFKFTG